MSEWLYYNYAVGSFHTKKPCSRLYMIEVEYYLSIKSRFWATLWALRGNVRTPSMARCKANGRLPIVVTTELLKWQSVEVGVFRRGWVTLSANFRWQGASPSNHCWCQKTRVIAPSFGIKISTVHRFVTKHACDRRTDRQRTDGQTKLRQLIPR